MAEDDKTTLTNTVKFIYGNLEAAQNKTGNFSMQDCKTLKQSVDLLLKTFTDCPDFAGADVNDAYLFLLKATEAQQKCGIFTIDGSIAMLEKLTVLEKWLADHKGASQKLKELKEAQAAAKNK